jgi:hypothetical protein
VKKNVQQKLKGLPIPRGARYVVTATRIPKGADYVMVSPKGRFVGTATELTSLKGSMLR